MRKARMCIMSAALAFTAIGGLHAQAQSGAKSISVQIVAVVPTILKIALDFSPSEIAQVTAWLPTETLPENDRPSVSNIEIKEGSVIELGEARIFSNTKDTYCIDILSANGGRLQSDSSSASSAIPYSLILGGYPASKKDGGFSFQAGGKTAVNGSALSVALAIGGVPVSAAGGIYSDRLMFSLSAN